jgi:hypothetical protein
MKNQNKRNLPETKWTQGIPTWIKEYASSGDNDVQGWKDNDNQLSLLLLPAGYSYIESTG